MGLVVLAGRLPPKGQRETSRLSAALGAPFIHTRRWRPIRPNSVTSAESEAPTLQRAEVKAWRDRLLGDKKPWASLYIVAETTSDAGTEESVTELAQQLGPELQQLMSELELH